MTGELSACSCCNLKVLLRLTAFSVHPWGYSWLYRLWKFTMINLSIFFITIHNKMLYPTIPIWANSWGLTLACFIHSKAPKPKILNVHLSTKCSHKRSWNYHTTALLFFFQLIKSLTQQACHNNYLVGGYAVPEIIRINGINVILRAYFATDVMII